MFILYFCCGSLGTQWLRRPFGPLPLNDKPNFAHPLLSSFAAQTEIFSVIYCCCGRDDIIFSIRCPSSTPTLCRKSSRQVGCCLSDTHTHTNGHRHGQIRTDADTRTDTDRHAHANTYTHRVPHT